MGLTRIPKKERRKKGADRCQKNKQNEKIYSTIYGGNGNKHRNDVVSNNNIIEIKDYAIGFAAFGFGYTLPKNTHAHTRNERKPKIKPN